MLKSLGNSREIPQSFNFVRPEMKKGKKMALTSLNGA